jgi:hypothetical protein
MTEFSLKMHRFLPEIGPFFQLHDSAERKLDIQESSMVNLETSCLVSTAANHPVLFILE